MNTASWWMENGLIPLRLKITCLIRLVVETPSWRFSGTARAWRFGAAKNDNVNSTILTSARTGVKTVCDLVAEQRFFKGLSPAQLHALAENARQTWFEAGEVIFRDGDPANRFYLIVEGKVAFESLAGGGRTALLQNIGAGELLGWSWIFAPYIWRVRARALEPTEAIFFYGTRLLYQCDADHDLGYEMFKRVAEVMMRRLQTTRELLMQKQRAELATTRDWRPGQH